MKVHHVGFLSKNLAKSQARFEELGFEIETEKKYDEIRKVNIAFLKNGDYRVELIEPVSEDSPMYPLLKRFKNTPYHFCYETGNLEESIEELTKKGFTVIQEPEIAPCIEGRRVVFLNNISSGIIELVES